MPLFLADEQMHEFVALFATVIGSSPAPNRPACVSDSSVLDCIASIHVEWMLGHDHGEHHEVKTRLRVRAADNGRSMEEEVRLILREAVGQGAGHAPVREAEGPVQRGATGRLAQAALRLNRGRSP